MANSHRGFAVGSGPLRRTAGQPSAQETLWQRGSMVIARRRGLAAAFGLIALTAVAAGLRFWDLAGVPPGFHYDEALEALEAWRVLTIPGYHPIFFPGDFGLAPTFIYLSSLAFRFWPATPALSRAIAALIGTATIPCLYALGQEIVLAGDRVPAATPFLAAAILAGLRWHITFSRVAIEPILVPFYLVLVLWVLFRGLRTNGRGAWLALGVTLGLSVYAYPAAWLLPPLVVALLAYLAAFHRQKLAGRGRGLVLAGILAALIVAPLAITLLRQPELILQRTGQVAATGQSWSGTLAGLGDNLVKALGMFSVAGDLDPRSNIPGRPALDLLLAAPFYLGVLLALRHWRRPAMAALLLAAAAMLANTIFSQYAPHFRRSLGLTPLIALFAGLGLATIARWRPQGRANTRFAPTAAAAPGRFAATAATAPGRFAPTAATAPGRLAPPAATAPGRFASDGRPSWPVRAAASEAWRPILGLVVLVILLGSSVLNVAAYFGEWGESPDLYYAYDEGLWDIANYVKTLPANQNLFLTPRPADDATLAFAWRAGPEVRHFDGRGGFIVAPSDRAATYLVIEHEDFRGAGLLTQLFPNAAVAREFRDRDGQVYARAFQVPAGSPVVRRPKSEAKVSWPAIDLIGYDLDKTVYHAGDPVYLQLWWRATAQPDTDWTVFTHLLGAAKPDGSILWAGSDDTPGQGSLPTSTWRAGDLILDEYQIEIGKDTPAGTYQIEIGLYNPAAADRRALTTNPPGQDRFILGQVGVQ